MLAEVLNAPVAELTMSDKINVGNDFFDSRALLILNAIFEDVLYDQAASFTKCDLVPHTAKGFIDLGHDLRWFHAPSEFEQLLPNMTSISVNDCVRNATKQFSNHVSFVFLRDRVESLLDDMAAERVHTEGNDIAVDSVSDSNDLVGRAMLETSLDKEIAKAINHERVRLINDGLHDFELLLRSTNFELLLQENGSLLVIVADYLVDDVLPVARN